MSTVRRMPARALAVPGLLLALVVTGSLPAWAGAASDRPADRSTVCTVDAAAADAAGGPRC
ncbi:MULTISPECIES: hypothetical protein [unclassified Blastococcus]